MAVSKGDKELLAKLKKLLEDEEAEPEEVNTPYGKALVFDVDESFLDRLDKWFGPADSGDAGTEATDETEEEDDTEEVEEPKKEPQRRTSNRFFGG